MDCAAPDSTSAKDAAALAVCVAFDAQIAAVADAAPCTDAKLEAHAASFIVVAVALLVHLAAFDAHAPALLANWAEPPAAAAAYPSCGNITLLAHSAELLAHAERGPVLSARSLDAHAPSSSSSSLPATLDANSAVPQA